MRTQQPCLHGFSKWFQCAEKMGEAEHWVLVSFTWLMLSCQDPFHILTLREWEAGDKVEGTNSLPLRM